MLADPSLWQCPVPAPTTLALCQVWLRSVYKAWGQARAGYGPIPGAGCHDPIPWPMPWRAGCSGLSELPRWVCLGPGRPAGPVRGDIPPSVTSCPGQHLSQWASYSGRSCCRSGLAPEGVWLRVQVDSQCPQSPQVASPLFTGNPGSVSPPASFPWGDVCSAETRLCP